MKKKGFTIFEALIVITLVSLASIFFVSVFTSAYRTTARSRRDTEVAFQGQTRVENEIVSIINQASDFNGGITGAIPPDRNVTVWNRNVAGYGLNVRIGDNPAPGQQNTFQANVFSFVFAGEKKPRIPVLTFRPLSSADSRLPKFMYIEEFFANRNNQYTYRYSVTDTQLIQRIMQREYFAARAKSVDGRTYIMRPFTDFKDETTLNSAPVYSSYFSLGYSALNTKGENLFGRGQLIPRTIQDSPRNDTIALPDFSTAPNAEQLFKDSHRDTPYLKTLQVQTVSGYATSEEVAKDSMTWFVGTPVLNGLVGQWDANLLFSNELTDNIVSYKDNTLLGSEWKSVKELAEKSKQLEVAISGSALLKVREDGTNNYRRFSNGIALPVDNGVNNRIKLQLENGKSLDRSKGGRGRMGEGSYSILIRAKRNIAGSDSALFTVNMDNIGSIIDTTSRTNEANGFYLVNNGNRIQYKYDAGTHIADRAGRFVDMTSLTDLQPSTYNANLADAQDERADYRIYELQITNAGRPDLFHFRLLVDNQQVAFQAPIVNHYSDLDTFGLDIGSNLEISDILVYDRVLSAAESRTMAEYLLNKYIIS